MQPLRLCDAHNHLQDESLELLRPKGTPQNTAPSPDSLAAPQAPFSLLNELQSLGVYASVVNGTAPSDWGDVETLCKQAPFLRASYGLHPWDCGSAPADWLTVLEQYLLRNPPAAVGEIGLDNWILKRAAPDDPRLAGLRRAPLEEQKFALHKQLDLAVRLKRPASIHCLDAFDELLGCLRSSTLPARGFLLHAYSGPAALVPAFAELGAYFSFNGAFISPQKKRARAAFLQVPEERLLVETDSPAMCLPREAEPFLWASDPTINHPANILTAYKGLAALRGLELGALGELCLRNFKRLFG